jgi:fructose-specific phosphotransferase system IIC component
VKRGRDATLIAALVPNVGGAIPFGLADPGSSSITAPEIVGSVLLGMAALGLALAWWAQAQGPAITWVIRIAAVVWIVVAVAVALTDQLTARERVGWALILAGVAIVNVVAAHRIHTEP